ncbi:MAG: GldG family protein [Candidatus Riflebacteria bacterium]|nr:GldG family protein [Candidatus Riflebacteria bacterium]
MMKDKRRIQIPVFPYILLILALISFVMALLVYINFPSKHTVAAGTAIAGLLISLIAFAARPVMVSELLTSRKTLLWVNDIVLILVIISIGVVLSHIGFRRNVRYDFTHNQIFSISDMTIQTVRNLNKDVRITAFYPKGTPEEGMIRDLLNEYKRHSDRLSFTLVDPMRDPVTTRAMSVGTIGTIVVQCEASRQDILRGDLFDIPSPYGPPDAKPKFTGEQVITSAIINVTSGIKRLVTFVKGHGEASVSGYQPRDIAGLNELLTSENFDVTEITLLEEDIDPRTSVLAIVAPQQDLVDAEIEKLRSYIQGNKGHLLVALDPGQSFDKLEDLIFKQFGVLYNNDIVVDPRGIQRNYWTVAPDLSDHPITVPIKEKNMLGLMFHCRSLTIEPKDGFKTDPILRTIENSWAKRGLNPNVSVEIGFEEGRDVRGPLNMGIVLERTGVASGAKALILGDSDFFSNAYISALANRDLIINSINWMVGQYQMITIRPRILEIPRIVIDETDAGKIFTVSVIGMPLLVILLGGIVYMVRRRV